MAIETRTDLPGGTVPAPLTTTRVYPTGIASLGLLFARVPLGIYFILAGVAKFRGGVGTFVSSQMPNATKFMSENLASMYLNALPYAEIALGAMLVLGLLTRVAGFVCAVLLASFMLAVTGVRHPQLPMHPNTVYLGLALALALCGPGRLSLDHLMFAPRRKVTITEKYTERLA